MASSSSASSSKKNYMYDVFLSFRGEDTRKTFVDHLNVALQRQGINTFKDDEELQKGKKINSELLKSIEESRFFIIILSKNYASSSWCLDELVKLMECQNATTEQIAYPVFYDVDPSEVRKQVGSVGEAFSNHKIKEEEVVGQWKSALKEASNLAGWDLRNTYDGHEAKVINNIVEKISLELRFTNLEVDAKLVGMESRIMDIVTSLEMSVEDVRMIGIKGMGGGGKTTLAQAVFDSICSSFEAKSFVENVREASKASVSGLRDLQKQLLSSVIKGKSFTIGSVHEGKDVMRKMLYGKKVLLILDDVDHLEQLEALAGGLDWFGPGSRVIITTRDEQVLVAHRVKLIRDVNLLSQEEAMRLFKRHAFGGDNPHQTYKELSLEVVHYAAGLPLTIKVLGSFLCGKDEVEWIDALDRLKTIPLNETLKKLELSYTSLEDDQKEIFLDVACFMKSWERDDAIKALESCGFRARIGLKVLEQKSLITIYDSFEDSFEDYFEWRGQWIGMHDHIEEMGRNIVRRSHPDEPIKHSRLWIEEDIEDVLSHDLVTEATRAIANDSCIFLKKSLRNLKKLRFLHVKGYDSKKKFEVDPIFPNTLQYLSWEGYPHWCLPETFQAKNLVVLVMPHSRIEQLWGNGEKKVLKNLKVLDLQDSDNLTTLDCGLLPNLEELNILRCGYLVELHVPSTGCLTRLVSLKASWLYCKQLQSLVKQLQSLQVLHLSFLGLTEFPDIGQSSYCLLKLELGGNDFKEVASSIGNLEKLVHLNLSRCENLKSLPQSICKLRSLKQLHLSNSGIEELPEDLGNLESLVWLRLYSTPVKHLPDSICKLKHLETLNLQGCSALTKLPEDLGNLESLVQLNLYWTRVKHLPDSICKLKHLETLNLQGCSALTKLPEDLGNLESLVWLDLSYTPVKHLPDSICKLKHLETLDLRNCSALTKLPEDLGNLESLVWLDLSYTPVKHLPDSICKLKHLETLDLRNCSALTKLPEDLGNLESLVRLNLYWTCVKRLPDSICKLKHLETLNLQEGSALTKLPEDLGLLESLEYLDLSGCKKIRDVPSSICKLKHLRELDISCCNQLVELPEKLGDMTCLEELDVRDTNIRHLPESISLLKGLKIIRSASDIC